MKVGTRGFTLLEVLLAIGLAAVVVLTLLALGAQSLRASQKSGDSDKALMVADNVLERVVAHVKADDPAGCRDSFWNDAGTAPWIPPWDANTSVTVEGTEYRYTIFTSRVTNQLNGQVLGTGPAGSEVPDNGLKKVDIVVEWWDEPNGSHQGYGLLEVRLTRLVKRPRES
ncbi:MAG: hypothetical protein AB7S38_24015 [Vulcanimicrobiota bacterium]